MHVRKGAGEARAGVDSLQESSFLSSAAALLTRRASLGILWLFVIAYAVRFAAVKLPATPAFNDFNHYYIGGLSLRLGANPYFVNFDTLAQKSGVELGGQDIENQPPTLLLCFKPLASLPPKTGYCLWIAASFASLAVAVWLMLKETSLDSRQALLFAGLFYLYPAVYEQFYFANMQVEIVLLLVLTIRYLGRDRDRTAALPLAFATALKAYPAIFGLYLVCRGRRRALVWMAIWGGIIGALTLWLFGPAAFSFLHTIGYTTSRGVLETPGYLSISSVVSRLFWRDGAVLSPFEDWVRRATVLLVELLVLGVTVSATLGPRADRGWRAFSLWVPAVIMLAPIGEPHYLVMLLIPFAAIADAAMRGEAASATICLAAASYLLTFSRYPLAMLAHFKLGSHTFFWVAGQFWVMSLVLLYVAVYRLSSDKRMTEPSISLTAGAAIRA
jgi:glycosyl transferase family 87